MKILGTITLIVGLGLLGGLIVDGVRAHYDYSNNFSSYWELSDKSSTISQKSEYLDKFISALEKSGLQGTNAAMFIKTPTQDFDQNMIAIKSLQKRMHDIQGMDENSFQYQTAIQQITEQEQGQAQDMLTVFHECWMRIHYYALWNTWLSLGWLILSIVLIILGLVFIVD